MIFSGKVALVTGAAAGIGRASALAFAREGARVVVCDVADEAGQRVAASISDAGGEAFFHNADMTSEAAVRELMSGILERYGRLDFAHNNVGFSRGEGLEGLSEADWDFTLDICLKSNWLGMKHELPIMVRQQSGAIVNTASMAGIRYTSVANVAYSAAKAAVIQMTRYAAAAYASHNIRVNSISPGLVRTTAVESAIPRDQQDEFAARTQPIGRIIEPEEIARSVIFLCSDQSASMITGENIAVAGGSQIL